MEPALSTPSCAVGAALSRDVLFVRVKRATYALHAIIAHHNQQRRAANAAVKAEGAAEGGTAEGGGAAEGSGAAEGKAEGEAAGQAGQAAGGEGGDPAGLCSPGRTKITVVKREEDEAGQAAEGQQPEEEEEEEEEDEVGWLGCGCIEIALQRMGLGCASTYGLAGWLLPAALLKWTPLSGSLQEEEEEEAAGIAPIPVEHESSVWPFANVSLPLCRRRARRRRRRASSSWGSRGSRRSRTAVGGLL